MIEEMRATAGVNNMSEKISEVKLRLLGHQEGKTD